METKGRVVPVGGHSEGEQRCMTVAASKVSSKAAVADSESCSESLEVGLSRCCRVGILSEADSELPRDCKVGVTVLSKAELSREFWVDVQE